MTGPVPSIKLDGLSVENPVNFKELSIDIQFDKDKSDSATVRNVSVGINEWEFAKEHKQIIEDFRQKYFFEGLPMQIDTVGKGVLSDTIEFLLAVKSANPITCNTETIPAIDVYDVLKKNREFTFEYLFEGAHYAHQNFNFIPTPYCKNAPNDAEIFMAFISSVLFIIELISVIEDLIDKISNCASFEWGEWIASIPFFIRLFVVAIAGVQIMLMLYNLLIQPIKYHVGMKLVDMFTVGYSFIGYDFKSTIFVDDPQWNRVVLLPKKLQVPENNDVENNLILDILGIDLSVLKGFTTLNNAEQTAYTDKNFNELIETFKEGMNLKEVIEAPTVAGESPTIRLERNDYGSTQNAVILPPIDIDEFTYNDEDFISNTTILFRTDTTDINTLTHYKGTEFTEHVYPTQWKNKKNLMVSGLKKVDVGFSRGIRKKELNKIEVIIDRLFQEVAPLMNDFVFQHNVKLKQAITIVTTIVDIVNEAIDAANTLPSVSIPNVQLPNSGPFQDVPFLVIPNFQTLIGNRVGMLLLENDEFIEDKLILIEEKFTLQNDSSTPPEYMIGDQLFPLFDQSGLEELQGISSDGDSPIQNVLDPENENVLSAENIFNKFHSINSFVPNIDGVTDWTNGKHGQYIKRETGEFILCCGDYRKLIGNNKMQWCEKDGEFFGSLNWNPFSKIATGKFRINEIYYRHLTSKKIIPNGSTRTK